MNTDAYRQHLHSQPIMKQIIDLIPYEDKPVFSKLLKTKGCDNDSNTPDVGQKEVVKPKPRAATVALVAQEDNDTPPQQAAHAVQRDKLKPGRNTE